MSAVIGYTDAGEPIYELSDKEESKGYAYGNSEKIQIIQNHIKRHIGPIAGVFHEMVSHDIHIDIIVVDPSPVRPFTL